MPFDPTRYRELIDHLDDNSHHIWRYNPEEMDAALRAARMLPEALTALEAVREYLEQSSFDVHTNIRMIDAIGNAIAAIEEVPNAAD